MEGDWLDDAVLHVGVDIAVKRDTAAVAAVAKHPKHLMYALWGHRIYTPPVNIHQTVVLCLERLLTEHRVAQILYDPYQFTSEAQRLAEKGYERLLKEVNQQSEMVSYANTLDTHLRQGTLLMYSDQEVRSHFSWAAAQETERGWRIVKRKQSRQIDVVVAIAMALAGATLDMGYMMYPSYKDQVHKRSFLYLP